MKTPLYKMENLRTRPAEERVENTLFLCCDFSAADLSGLHLEDCVFEDCRLSGACINGTAFNGVHFKRCVLAGFNFYEAYRLVMAMAFEECALDFCSFQELSLKKTVFKNCSLRSAVFTGADLSGAVFDQCDLSRALFHKTRLDKADLSSSYNFVIDPDDNSLKKTSFSSLNLAGLLEKYDLDIK